MKYFENDTAGFYCNDGDPAQSFIAKIAGLIKNHPFVLEPFPDIREDIRSLLAKQGLLLYSTVKKTTLIYDPESAAFLKILHPLNIRSRVVFLLVKKAKTIYNTSEYLSSKGIKMQRVIAYGIFKNGSLPFFAVKKAEGESLYDILIRGGRSLTVTEYRKVIDEVARLHSLGYWLGDAHLSHIFIKDGEVSGLIDIDGIRKNRPYMLKNLAKDIAGLNHPDLPLTNDEKKSLLGYYLDKVKVSEEDKFIQLVKYYTERRWKD
ncbi:MAG: hypothetical protein HZA14_01080 [Nitrospirae bacterium]|nr:hypothetical protein [Nitrospirota bacterium]